MQGPLGYDLMGRKNSAGKSCKSNLLNYYTNVIIATQEKESFMIEEEKEVLVSYISVGP